MNQSVIPIQYG